ncbi:M14 family metallopeptidase [Salinibacillus xinjiangensis]|uniref:LysM peptidoglycan-binding domain-containing protein n=1 Tax=Salinibacillus xinjiangensis TaxID=1229268 RepID=A0A6G1X4C5_9BACI|nr:M14 family metallopeptidase [Salinibacillus xinjiangensis]MRG85797.1 LysM peptidoglycan-binding domain-containing protein [Salinibacillus xinjiangensis]
MNITVNSGDNLWAYSQVFQIPLQLIIDSNPDINPSRLAIGQNIRIPGFVTETYTVQSGDTFWRIAQQQNIPISHISFMNRQINPANLFVGQEIILPRRVTWRVVNGNQPYTYNDLIQDMRVLAYIYPFIRTLNIGQSVMGKSIPEFVIGRGEKQVHWNGSFHANEWITTPVIMTFINDYLLALTNQQPIRGLQVQPYYHEVLLSVVPMVNPDGVNLVIEGPPDEEPYREQVLDINNGRTNFSNWKANIRGVDLNNQYPARWEIEKERKEQQPAPRDYPGEAPLTEPEAIAIAELTGNRNFDRVLAFHTQGEVIYWGFENLEPPEAETIVNEFARVSGYQPIQTVDSYAGYKDWFIQEWRRPGYTVELGQGINPLPLSQFEEIYQETLGIFLASLYL